jgi:glycosyltransferase involved in cell wall biosynthesis
MKHKKNIVISSGLYPSEGMLTLIKYLSYSMLETKNFNKKYRLKILIFNENFFFKIKKIIYNFYLRSKNLFKENHRIHKFSISVEAFKKDNKKLVNYISTFQNEEDYKKFNCDVLLPMQNKNNQENFVGIGYIYDLQHLDIPSFFSRQEIKKRTQNFKDILNSFNYTITNSKFVKRKIIKNFSPIKSKIIALPFLPFQENYSFFKKKIDIKKKYNIEKDFFIISNKFWKHKNHIVAFKAFKKLIKYNPNYCLVCTGETFDSRFPNYFKDLSSEFLNLINKGNIKILNVIPKDDQINLIRNSLGLIQPTLYEGGPGGFSVYEAISIGKKVIISNIPINKEISKGNKIFFKANNSNDLYLKLKKIINKKNTGKNRESLFLQSKKNKIRLGNFILKLINKSLKEKKLDKVV